jgi:histidine ammonia-lyase
MAPRDSLASISVNAVSFAAAAEAVRSAAGTVRILMAVSVLSSGALGASPEPWRAATYVGTDVEALVGTCAKPHGNGLGRLERMFTIRSACG